LKDGASAKEWPSFAYAPTIETQNKSRDGQVSIKIKTH
jgi:hypothetical protein